MTAPLLTVPEVAAALRVSPDTVRDYLRTGKLAGVRPGGGNWRVRQADLEAFIAGPVGPRSIKPRPVTGTVMRHVRGAA